MNSTLFVSILDLDLKRSIFIETYFHIFYVRLSTAGLTPQAWAKNKFFPLNMEKKGGRFSTVSKIKLGELTLKIYK